MNLARSFLLLPVLGLCACGSTTDPLAALKGSYQIFSGCVLKVESGKASASCDTGTKKLTLDVTFSGTTVEVKSVSYTVAEPASECFTERVCTTAYSGSAAQKGSQQPPAKDMAAVLDKPPPSPDGVFTVPDATGPLAAGDGVDPTTKDSGTPTAGDGSGKKSVGGLFSGLAGEWTGTLVSDFSCSKETLKTGAGTWCKTGQTKKITYTYSALVKDHEAKFTWSGSPSGGAGSFMVYETVSGVRAADTLYPRVTDSGKKDSGKTVDAKTTDGSAG